MDRLSFSKVIDNKRRSNGLLKKWIWLVKLLLLPADHRVWDCLRLFRNWFPTTVLVHHWSPEKTIFHRLIFLLFSGNKVWDETIWSVEHHKKLAKRNCKVIIAFRTSKASPKSVSDLCSQIKVDLTFLTGSKYHS